MADEIIQNIKKIKVGNVEHPIEVDTFGGKEAEDYQVKSNMVKSTDTLSSSSTDNQYPSAKLVYDTLGWIENALRQI